MFSCEFCEIFKDTSGGSFYILKHSVPVTAQNLPVHSSLPNRCVPRNERGGGKDKLAILN